MSYYCFHEDDLRRLVAILRKSKADEDTLFKVCLIESRGVIDKSDVNRCKHDTCVKCGKNTYDAYDHQIHSGDLSHSAEYECDKSSLEIMKCPRCEVVVDDKYGHQVFEGDYTYSSEWNCEYD